MNAWETCSFLGTITYYCCRLGHRTQVIQVRDKSGTVRLLEDEPSEIGRIVVAEQKPRWPRVALSPIQLTS
jgi:hypothetical protein